MEIKNKPDIIYLNHGIPEEFGEVDWNDDRLQKDEITWCIDKIQKNDIPYYSEEFLFEFAEYCATNDYYSGNGDWENNTTQELFKSFLKNKKDVDKT